MRIPADAIIATEKLTRYLLAPRSKNDKSRWLARAGFTLRNSLELDGAIRRLAASTDAVEEDTHQWGTDYTVTGNLPGPGGPVLAVKIIWIRRVDGQFHLVTLMPSKEKQ